MKLFEKFSQHRELQIIMTKKNSLNLKIRKIYNLQAVKVRK